MSQYWTRKGDKDDKDERTVCPWTEHVGHGNICFPEPDPEDDERPEATLSLEGDSFND